jgi:poly(3-hydroxybutyrate) depolymerase
MFNSLPLNPWGFNPYMLRQISAWVLGPWRLPLQILTAGNPYARAMIDVGSISLTDRRKPKFDIESIEVAGRTIHITEEVACRRPWCTLTHFGQTYEDGLIDHRDLPVVLLVAPLSGHHATLLRDTVHRMLGDADVYITEWVDAKMVPVERGAFTLDDYVEYLERFFQILGTEGKFHVVAVCQGGVPAIVAAALQSGRKLAGQPGFVPQSMSVLGAPISVADKVSASALQMLSFTRMMMIQKVPTEYPGVGRAVCPGYMQQGLFMWKNVHKHLDAHSKHYFNLFSGDDDPKHNTFYNEYNAYLDMPAEYYEDNLERVFIKRNLANGTWYVRGRRVDLSAVTAMGLFSISGMGDDIVHLLENEAILEMTPNIPSTWKQKRRTKGGHYGLFSGREWREETWPEILSFMESFH